MPGFWGGLLNAGTAAATGIAQGQDEAEKAIIARQMQAEQKRVRDAQIREADARTLQLTHEANRPQPWQPTTEGEYQETHPQGWRPQSLEEYQSAHPGTGWHPQSKQDYLDAHPGGRGGAGAGRPDIPYGKVISGLNAQIGSNQRDISGTDQQLKGYNGKETMNRGNVDKQDIPQFVADSTAAAGLRSQRRQFVARGDSLNVARDQGMADLQHVLGLHLGRGAPPTPPGAPPSLDGGVAPDEQSLYNEAGAAFQRDGDQAKYNKVVAAISQKYHPAK